MRTALSLSLCLSVSLSVSLALCLSASLPVCHFDSYRAEHPHLFTMFYAPWCGHCKNLKPDYVEASSAAPRAFTFAAVDCTVHTDTCNAVPPPHNAYGIFLCGICM